MSIMATEVWEIEIEVLNDSEWVMFHRCENEPWEFMWNLTRKLCVKSRE
jgi:hypothetical protein